MRRKKSEPPKAPPRISVVIHGTPEWKEWIEEAAAHCRLTAAAMFDHAVIEFATKRGFDKPAPRR